MKTIKLFIPLCIGLSALFAYPAFARSSEEPVEVDTTEKEEYIEAFPDLDENDKILPLGEGWLHGQATVTDGGNEIQYDSDTDPNAITVKELREKLYKEYLERNNNAN